MTKLACERITENFHDPSADVLDFTLINETAYVKDSHINTLIIVA